jgi:exonuclease SbcC
MHVTRVELENIKSYPRADFAFGRGTTAIVGPNGAGKTTILEAIAWALFDVLDYSKDDFLRRGQKRGSVRVTFQSDLDERLYTVYRDTGTSYYVYDPELKVKLQQGKADVRKWLDMHLGVEPGSDLRGLFRSAIGVPQGLFTTDFLQTPADRKKAFDRLLKVEEYRESADRLRDTAALINERITDVRIRISGAEAQLARYDELHDERQAAARRAADLEAQLAALQSEAEQRARIVAEFEAAERRVTEARTHSDRLGVERDSAERRLNDLTRELEAARRASARQRATEQDYAAHLSAVERLRALESERAERDRLLAEAAAAERRLSAAEAEARRATDALARALAAREQLIALSPAIAAQTANERERERLRDLLAQARAAGEQLVRLDRELDALRKSHSDITRRVRAAEGFAGSQTRAEQLESERMEVETLLSRLEQSLTAREHLSKQRADCARDVERQRRTVIALEREAREFGRAAREAERLSALEGRERELAEQAANLRAAISRDERSSQRAKGGVCPILHENCKNLAESGRTFEDYFGEQLRINRAQLSSIEREYAEVALGLKAAREAAVSAAKFEAARTRLGQERELLAEREAELALIDERLSEHSSASAARREELQAQMTGVDLSWKQAREEAMRYAEIEPLRARQREIEEEGKARREERELLAAAAGAEADLTRDAAEVERRLRELGDPRGHAAALAVEAERETELRHQEATAKEVLSALEKQKADLETELARFSELNAAWAEAAARRDETAAAYREHLESASLAATLPDRERDAQQASEQLEALRREAEAASLAYEQALRAYDRERHDAERGALALARERAAATTAQLEAARERESSLAAELARLEAVRESLREEFRAKERLEELFEATDFIRDTLKKAGPLVTESYLYNISIDANHLFREITGEGGRALRWTRDYDIVLEEGGHERPFVNLSGGEQMAAALSVRLALLKQLSDIRVAFFDEPTVNMDAERRERLAQQIGQVRDFDQLFVISHDDTFEQAVDHVVSVSAAEVGETV